MKKSMKIRVIKHDYEYDTDQLVFETEISNVISIKSGGNNNGDGKLIIVTKGDDSQCFVDDYYTVHHIEFASDDE